MATNNGNDNQRVIVLSFFDFVYLFISLVLLHPDIYYNVELECFEGGYTAATIVYLLGILYPLLSKFITGTGEDDKLLRIADIATLAFGLLSLCAIIVRYALSVGNWIVWFAYAMAVLTAAPSLFSLIRASRRYIG